MNRDEYPANSALKTWTVGDLDFYIVDCRGSHLCGYVRFPERPVKERTYHGILTYVPVHGGITYADQKDGGMVYGFDCGHAGDEERPETKDPEWVGVRERLNKSFDLHDNFGAMINLLGGSL